MPTGTPIMPLPLKISYIGYVTQTVKAGRNSTVKLVEDISFWKLWNISFGFFGVQIAYALQSANISRIFWAAKVVQIEQSNLRLNEELPEVFMPYREAGLHPILLKGS